VIYERRRRLIVLTAGHAYMHTARFECLTADLRNNGLLKKLYDHIESAEDDRCYG